MLEQAPQLALRAKMLEDRGCPRDRGRTRRRRKHTGSRDRIDTWLGLGCGFGLRFGFRFRLGFGFGLGLGLGFKLGWPPRPRLARGARRWPAPHAGGVLLEEAAALRTSPWRAARKQQRLLASHRWREGNAVLVDCAAKAATPRLLRTRALAWSFATCSQPARLAGRTRRFSDALGPHRDANTARPPSESFNPPYGEL